MYQLMLSLSIQNLLQLRKVQSEIFWENSVMSLSLWFHISFLWPQWACSKTLNAILCFWISILYSSSAPPHPPEFPCPTKSLLVPSCLRFHGSVSPLGFMAQRVTQTSVQPTFSSKLYCSLSFLCVWIHVIQPLYMTDMGLDQIWIHYILPLSQTIAFTLCPENNHKLASLSPCLGSRVG
jgi:hypothetical protein